MIDRRAALKGGAVTHALLIGVSAYDHVDSLDAGAHTAARLYQWLKNADAEGTLPAPLATVTLLLSPTATERAAVETVADPAGWATPTCTNIKAARDRLRNLVLETEKELKRSDDQIGAGTAIYYFGGHGHDFFRDDPIGLARDADDRSTPWVGAFDQFEFREQLTHIQGDGIAVEHPHRVRCLFLYDCCRERTHDAVFTDAVPVLQYPLVTESRGLRPFLAISAAIEGSPAWEPNEAIALPPGYELPLSFFGHGLLNAMTWAQDEAFDPRLPWQTSAQGLQNDLKRAMDELAKHDAEGTKLPGAMGPPKSYPPDFALLRADKPPAVTVALSCDPETGCRTKTIEVHQRVGANYLPPRAFPPWTNHPESCNYVPGLFMLKVVAGPGTCLEKVVRLQPALGPWQWIVRDDAITVHDPAD